MNSLGKQSHSNEYMYSHIVQHQTPSLRSYERDTEFILSKIYSPDNKARERRFSPDIEQHFLFQKFSKSPMLSNLGKRLFDNENQYSHHTNIFRPSMKND